MESYETMMRRRAREAAKKAKIEKIKSAAGEILGSVVFIGLLFGLCWLCFAASGYHWE